MRLELGLLSWAEVGFAAGESRANAWVLAGEVLLLSQKLEETQCQVPRGKERKHNVVLTLQRLVTVFASARITPVASAYRLFRFKPKEHATNLIKE